MRCSGCSEQRKLVLEISKIDFAITEMNLYLDTHPYDVDAIEQCKRYINRKRQLEREYALKYPALSLDDITGSSKEWNWALQPSPWERGY